LIEPDVLRARIQYVITADIIRYLHSAFLGNPGGKVDILVTGEIDGFRCPDPFSVDVAGGKAPARQLILDREPVVDVAQGQGRRVDGPGSVRRLLRIHGVPLEIHIPDNVGMCGNEGDIQPHGSR